MKKGHSPFDTPPPPPQVPASTTRLSLRLPLTRAALASAFPYEGSFHFRVRRRRPFSAEARGSREDTPSERNACQKRKLEDQKPVGKRALSSFCFLQKEME